MTYDRWKQIERLQWEKVLKANPTMNRRRLQRDLHRGMILTHGECPPKPSTKPPLKIRLGLWWLKRKLKGVKPVEVPMLVKKLVVSLMYGLGASGPVVQLALADNVISGNEWGAILSAFVAAAWGTFKSNTTVIAPSRKGETITSGPR